VTAAALVLVCCAGVLFACSSDDASITFMGEEAGVDASLGFGSDGSAPVTGDDSGPPPAIDAAPPPSCPGTALPSQTSTACAIDTSNGCPSCASWGYACPGATSPVFPSANASGLCRATAVDGGADGGGSLICCTRPMCVASDLDGGCDGAAPKRYECSGGAVPTGTCTWSGASSPNDYCCQ
jgi:hypothetical protein